MMALPTARAVGRVVDPPDAPPVTGSRREMLERIVARQEAAIGDAPPVLTITLPK